MKTCATALLVLLAFAASAAGTASLSPPPAPVAQATTNKLARSPRSGQIHWGEGSKDGVPYAFAYRVRTPKRIPATPEQVNAVESVFEGIIAAYEKNDVDGMKAQMAQLPDAVTNMTQESVVNPIFGAVRALDKRFLFLDGLNEFSEVKDFEGYCRASIDLAVFLGNLFLKREDYDSPVAQFDFRVLKQLQRYKARFREQARADLAQSADRFIGEWERQIESEDGFTRQYMWYQVDLQWPSYHDGSWSLDRLSAWAKQFADDLVNLGYTPKWLSEFNDLSEAVK